MNSTRTPLGRFLWLGLCGLLLGCATTKELERTRFNPSKDREAVCVFAVPALLRQGLLDQNRGIQVAPSDHVIASIYRIRWIKPDGSLYRSDTASLPPESSGLVVRLRLAADMPLGQWRVDVEGPNRFRASKEFELSRE